MQLFKVPAGQRVRITSKLVRWVEHSVECGLGENVTWEGTTTDRYVYYKGAERRLLIDHTIDWPEYGVWQRDCTCEVIESTPRDYRPKKQRGLLIDE